MVLYPEIEIYIKNCLKDLDSISASRLKNLNKIIRYIKGKIQQKEEINLVYLCTHNSRRSQYGQIWGKIAAEYYGISGIRTFSGGTEITAFHPVAVKTAQEAGFRIQKLSDSLNSGYEVYYSEALPPIRCYSKLYTDQSIPSERFCTIVNCTEADSDCPLIPGSDIRVFLPYSDPRAFDYSPIQSEKYHERFKEIATENLYIFSKLKAVKKYS
jgi:arsenate reductase (thioredoxin)